MAKVADVIRGWLGWCPNGNVMRAKQTGVAGIFFMEGNARVPATGDTGDTKRSRDGQYEHTQRGSVILAAVGTAIILILVSLIIFEPVIVQVLVLLILIFVLAIMSRLTVSVTDDQLKIRFGPVGLVHKEWALSDIISATPVTNQWIYGWGIRWTPHGRLYNVAGSMAVEILLLSGEKVRIGTDEPEKLCRALQKACNGIATPVRS
ncbi:MAG: DUF1673 family protein [Methanomicrobiales archaeon]|nr:DUF1673 family protein [Methanomicrobiales archaeon]